MSAVLALLAARKEDARVFVRNGRLVIQSQGQLPKPIVTVSAIERGRWNAPVKLLLRVNCPRTSAQANRVSVCARTTNLSRRRRVPFVSVRGCGWPARRRRVLVTGRYARHRRLRGAPRPRPVCGCRSSCQVLALIVWCPQQLFGTADPQLVP